MDPYNQAQVQAVWERVMQGREEDLGQALLEMIAAEYASARAYEKMVKQSGIHGPTFRRLAREEWHHASRLTALYDLLYGRGARVASGVAQTSGGFHEALRRAFQGELKAAEQYREAARNWPIHAQLFEELAQQEQGHSRTLHQIAQSLPTK